MLREEDREWVKHQEHRYKMVCEAGSRIGSRSASDRQRDLRLRQKIERAFEDLVWLARHWPPDQQNRVFTEERIRKLVAGVLTSAYENEIDADSKRREQRQYRIAALLMEKGIAKCLKRVQEPYIESLETEALRLTLTLRKAAVGFDEGVSLSVTDC